ncbi:hypothetical protein D0861_04860 [Lecanosticta acicola]|uniref:F-box domain-containing protein n=1 Tax=Lecanosticta acicola TaxID=111012 RepID=A0AAI9E7H4_9PEZI|nr:hypothetical protein D0861_04860 [Lecanosticta acicola]
MAPTKRKAGDDGTAEKKKLQRRNATNASLVPTQRRVTRQMTTDGPRQAVFATAELLENIMLHLPIRTTYTSQRVCQQFRDIVKSSVMIQQKLFIRPTLPDDKVWELRRDRDEMIQFVSVPGDPSTLKEEELRGQFRPVRLNPLLRTRYQMPLWMFWFEDEQVEFAVDRQLNYRSLEDQGLWFCSQLTDPPCRLADIQLYWCMKQSGQNTAEGRLDARVKKPDGIRIAHLWDAMMNAKANRYRTGSQYHNVEEKSFAELHTQLVQDGFRPVTLKTSRMFIDLPGVAIASENDWKNVCGDGNQVEEQEKSP